MRSLRRRRPQRGEADRSRAAPAAYSTRLDLVDGASAVFHTPGVVAARSVRYPVNGKDIAVRTEPKSSPLPPSWDAALFDRVDPEPDTRFYAQPRFVQHIDDGAITAVTAAIHRFVPPKSDVLDLMSSWVSHLPDPAELPLSRIVGLGLNADELAGNPRLDAWTVQDLNAKPRLPYAGGSFDAVLITVSIQYLTRPDLVLREVARVLRPEGVVIISFSNRMFPTKAVRIWQETADADRPRLVFSYLREAGGFDPVDVVEQRSGRGFISGDPLWAVVARRSQPRPYS